MLLQRRPGNAEYDAEYSDIVAMFSIEAQVIIKNIERVSEAAAGLEQQANRLLLEISLDLPRSEEYKMVGDRLRLLSDQLDNLQDALMLELNVSRDSACFWDYDDGDSRP
ncbi:uncharacterized protein BDZ99DRAFT_569947 [Mytilinidion resinicola]|uniref:Uncharacterized protein n=1 Tax=Mytilinidion resinicola TaxID=574789 RepID=A0A6A6YTZ9_9PEZI|nr:uncharacterized protein BDZ99DRAFT_569947 [Mytilinidion resinicola]KAF2812018.1 hypothetical protein BDZ99DRAFT_569947 [Mytilinidion resinicola]